jgi:hypothetical protein
MKILAVCLIMGRDFFIENKNKKVLRKYFGGKTGDEKSWIL